MTPITLTDRHRGTPLTDTSFPDAAPVPFRRALRGDTPPKTAAEAWQRLLRAHATAFAMAVVADDLDAAARHAERMAEIEGRTG